MDRKYLMHLANAEITAKEYKIVLALLVKPMTATQVSTEVLGIKQNTDRHFKKLRSMGLIEIANVEGRNKYYKAVTDMRKLEEIMPGQIKL